MNRILPILLLILLSCRNTKEIKMPKYEMPDIILHIEKKQKERTFDTEAFEFAIDYYEDSRYSICPIDAIPFGSTGNNGIHFAFLTDFGQNTNLEKAPIICIAPSYDPPINLVARNIFEFFSIVTTIENSTLLADEYQNQEQFEKRKEEWFDDWMSEPKIAEPRKKQAEDLKLKFKLKGIHNVVEYTSQIRNERDKVIKTYKIGGSLGVNPFNNEEISKFKHTKDTFKIKEYLENENKSSRLQFYRDCVFNFILSKNFDFEIKQIIIKYLEKDGYIDEADNLRLTN